MQQVEVTIERPQRWDIPFGESMTDDDVVQLLKVEPFRSIDPDRFPAVLPLKGIMRNDARIVAYENGDIVVRRGDYGHSAFLVLRGQVRVALEGLDRDEIGAVPSSHPTLWKSFAQLWQNPRQPEMRHQVQAGGHLRSSADGCLASSRVFLQDVPRVIDENRTVTLESGEFFGELAALTRSQRSFTVFAEGEVLLLEIRWQGLRDLMRRTDALREHIELLYRKNSLRVHLRETPLLSSLPADQLQVVADATQFESHGDFDWHESFQSVVDRSPSERIVSEPLIAEEGAACNGLLLVRSGFARLSHRFGHGHQTVAYLGKGQVFALAESLESIRTGQPVPLKRSLRALGYVDVLRIPLRVLEQHVCPYLPQQVLDDTLRQLGDTLSGEDWKHSPQTVPTDPVDTALLEFLVDHRFTNGQQTMLLDLDRCTRCDDCVRACAATHDNNPRFVRHGPRHGSHMVANACMHCIDPVCMIGCPTGAIGRESATGLARINDLTCIGCGTCAGSCPYDNIRMVEIRNDGDAIVLDEATQQPILKATKCDLCADQVGGPACQRACPHDALIRLDLGNLGELSSWVNR